MSRKLICTSWLVWAVTAGATATLLAAEQNTEDSFQRGFYLQSHEGDLAGAMAAYQQVLADPNAPESLRAEAHIRLARCREDLQTTDLAQLMPADAVAYVEISRPGQHLVQLAKLMGLVRDPTRDQETKIPSATQVDRGVFLPDDLALSPALIAELEKVRGIAAAVTSIEPDGKPNGVVVVHPGQCDLIRGLLETSIQFLEPAEPIQGFRTYCIEREAWLAVTHRLLIVSPSRDMLAATIGRLDDAESDSLAKQPTFASLRDERKDALVFAYVAGQMVAETIRQQAHGQQLRIASTVLDLQHVQDLTAALRTTDSNVELEINLNLEQGHHNVLYGLVQTAPITKQSLRSVPAEAAAVAVLGLNPATPGTRTDTASRPTVSLMDIGREMFGNVVELSLFVLPAQGEHRASPAVPEIGLVLATRQPEKSEALWTQLMALPSLLGAPGISPPREITLEGQPAREYYFPDAPPIVLARLASRELVGGTPAAVAAAIAAQKSGKTVAKDPALGPSINTLADSSSKAVFVHVGRVLGVVASVDPNAARELAQVRPHVSDLTVMLMTDEGPNAFALRAEIAGLPDVPGLIKRMALGAQAATRPSALTAAGHRR